MTMDNLINYQIEVIKVTTWLVGYHIEKDVLFLYKYNEDETVTIMHQGHIDLICFWEYIRRDTFIELGEL